ncbi:hypothetical protein P691DRAFT_770793 [Macrolepiota fuliginosa MF-IS2]|uniref:RRM domain-containing protein n=1 Tax=Macrolepiota fuliginosa MF-IS2 TaxID=1400762 RepID=A0A9P6C6V6_9AGAR|nr:hypothetical protein P691DRAFT_770793 [Macrolepiota fuliginosa MF-IS2]
MPPKHPNQTRAWGTRYDTLPTSPPVSPETERDERQRTAQGTEAPLVSQTVRKDDKLPHDASVFVGSLPSNVDQAELTRLLTGHLSEHAEIKSIKVVRDSKGGVCAFVQCEDAASASAFLQSLQTSHPKPFLGRILRYEPARAFRTLLISYRAPSQVIIPGRFGRTSRSVLELELPHAIRVWKPKNTKYHHIVYNGEATEAERYARALSKDDTASVKEDAVYLHPLKFDAESVIKLAKYFGPLEKVSKLTATHELVKAPSDGDLTCDSYPPPHNLPRSKIMDTNCWEVKWDHRDDCVTALMALRRIPHLSVSWAHQLQGQHIEQLCHLQGYQQSLNHIPSTQPRIDRFQRYTAPGFASPPGLTPVQGVQPPSAVFGDHHTILQHDRVEESPNWVNPTAPPGLGCKPPSTVGVPLVEMDDQPNPLVTTKIDWADAHFTSFIDSEYDSKIDWSAWGGSTRFEKDIRSPCIIASHSACEVLSPQRTRGSPVRVDDIPTPGLVMSPPTPRTALSQTPVTPINQTREPPLSGYGIKTDGREQGDNTSRTAKQFDPTTLFVGGLEMYGPGAWTDEKVKSFFGRFGGLEYARVVRPPNGNTAFAFVKYNNTDSPARAILEEHNRVYAGRALKVQLRDVNPPRSPWKHARGRGRFSYYHSSRKTTFPQRAAGNLVKHETTQGLRLASGNVETNKADLSNSSSAIETDDVYHHSPPIDKQKPDGPMARVLENTQNEKYREWYDAPFTGSSPESGGAFGSAAIPLAASGMPYQLPGYYPMSWVPPCAQPGHYQMPYYGPYPGYPLPTAPIQPYSTTPPGSDINGTTAGGHPWPGTMYHPYAPYFGPSPRLTVGQVPPASNQASQSSQGPSRAPLVPSGFIHNDQGTLIAVYPPEALDQYMAGQNAGFNGGSNPSISTQSISATGAWSSGQTLPGSASNYSIVSHVGNNLPRLYPVPTNPPWNPMPPPFVHMPPGLVTNPALSTYSVNATSRSDEDQGDTNSPSSNLGRKQANRRDFTHQNINRSSRTINSRNGRDHIHNQNLAGNTEGVNPHYRNSQAMNAPEWNQWTRRRGSR